jgi:hypothetical protein
MIYLTAHGYANGNPAKIFRATDQNGLVCGEPGSLTESYPYAYFYNPTSLDLSKRYCVKTCPDRSTGALPATLDAYPTAVTFAITISSTGTPSTPIAGTGSLVIGY